jgi:glucan phosphoethanolaminetransferase (alkaline phosphatase superfamily)
MEKSRSLAGIVGPSMIAIVSSELRVWNPTLYETQITPLVYLSGVLLFIAGLAIVRKHNVWVRNWETVLTVVGWLGMALGIVRMYFPQLYNAQFENDNYTLAFEIILILVGAILTFKAYWPVQKQTQTNQ